jgi:hypothetical protein
MKKVNQEEFHNVIGKQHTVSSISDSFPYTVLLKVDRITVGKTIDTRVKGLIKTEYYIND